MTAVVTSLFFQLIKSVYLRTYIFDQIHQIGEHLYQYDYTTYPSTLPTIAKDVQTRKKSLKGRELEKKSLMYVVKFNCHHLFKEMYQQFISIPFDSLFLGSNIHNNIIKNTALNDILECAIGARNYVAARLLCSTIDRPLYHSTSSMQHQLIMELCELGWQDIFMDIVATNTDIKKTVVMSGSRNCIQRLVKGGHTAFLKYFLELIHQERVYPQIKDIISHIAQSNLEIIKIFFEYPIYKADMIANVQRIFEFACLKCRPLMGDCRVVDVLSYLQDHHSAKITIKALANALQVDNEHVLNYLLENETLDRSLYNDKKVPVMVGFKSHSLLDKLLDHPLICCKKILEVSIANKMPLETIHYLLCQLPANSFNLQCMIESLKSGNIELVMDIEDDHIQKVVGTSQDLFETVLCSAIQSNNIDLARYIFKRYSNSRPLDKCLLQKYFREFKFLGSTAIPNLELTKLLYQYDQLDQRYILSNLRDFKPLIQSKDGVEFIFGQVLKDVDTKNKASIDIKAAFTWPREKLGTDQYDYILCYLYDNGWLIFNKNEFGRVLEYGSLELAKRVIRDHQIDQLDKGEHAIALPCVNLELLKYLIDSKLFIFTNLSIDDFNRSFSILMAENDNNNNTFERMEFILNLFSMTNISLSTKKSLLKRLRGNCYDITRNVSIFKLIDKHVHILYNK